jgi:hypothetical protein
MLLVGAMGEVETTDINTGENDFFQHFNAAGCRSDGGDNFSFVKFTLIHGAFLPLQMTQSP